MLLRYLVGASLLVHTICALDGAPNDVAGEEVFPPGERVLTEAKYLRLEDFFDKNNTLPQRFLERLTLDISLLNYSTADAGTDNSFYMLAARNLHHAAPNLRQLTLDGGYTFFPANATRDSVRTELEFLKKACVEVVRALKAEKIEIGRFYFAALFYIPAKVVAESGYPKILNDLFKKTVGEYDLERGVVENIFKIEDVVVDIELTFQPERLFKLATVGRLPLVLNRKRPAKKKPSGSSGASNSTTSEPHPRYFFTIEKFYNQRFADHYKKDPNLQTIYYMLATLIRDERVKADTFYRKAVQHLREAAPNVRKLELWGGFAINPRNGTAETLHHELVLLKQNLESMLRAFRTYGIRITSYDFEGYMNFNEEAVVESNYPEIVKDLFGYEVTKKEIYQEVLEMKLYVYEVKCHIKLSFFFEPSIQNLRRDRMGFLHLPEWD